MISDHRPPGRDHAGEHVGVPHRLERLFGQRGGAHDLLSVRARQDHVRPHRLFAQEPDGLIVKQWKFTGGETVRLCEPLQRANGASELAVHDGGLRVSGRRQAVLDRCPVVRDDAADEQSGHDQRRQQRPDEEDEQVRAEREMAAGPAGAEHAIVTLPRVQQRLFGVEGYREVRQASWYPPPAERSRTTNR